MLYPETKPLIDVGDVIEGRYRVEQVLGQGAMGIVVAAIHLELHQSRAIKFMLPEVMTDRESVERFLREARAAARLQSRHAVRVHDVARLPTGEPYIVMEHLQGTDLKRHLHQKRSLPVAEAAFYIAQACEAIAEAHGVGIIHRDLKPANIFLAHQEGGPPCVKVLDFGIAKLNDSQTRVADGSLTSSHMVIGSPPFMSPEQIISTRDVDARTDIWSLGVILYAMVVGRLPFRGPNPQIVFAAVQRDTPPRPTELSPDLSPEFEQIILRCLEKDPPRRYASANELAAALAPFAKAHALLMDPATVAANAMTQLWKKGEMEEALSNGAPRLPEPEAKAEPQHRAPSQPKPVMPSPSSVETQSCMQPSPQSSPHPPPQSDKQKGGEAAPPSSGERAKESGRQADPPVTEPRAPKARRRGLGFLLAGGSGLGLGVVAFMLSRSPAPPDPAAASPDSLHATTAAPASSEPAPPAAEPSASMTSLAAVPIAPSAGGTTDTHAPPAEEASSHAKAPPSPRTPVAKSTQSTPPRPAASAASKAALRPARPVPRTGRPAGAPATSKPATRPPGKR